MDFFQACLKADGRAAVNAIRKMVSSARPSAIWAVLMHGAAWHEQRTYDTPHSTIVVNSIHRMIEDLGNHPGLSPNTSSDSIKTQLEEERRMELQELLVQRLAFHLTDIDHWAPEKGPRYNVNKGIDSPDNALRRFTTSLRQKSDVGAWEASVILTTKEDPVRLRRVVASLTAEEPDKLGHGYIMPYSLIAELPNAEYTRPHIAVLWHLMEYLVRKVPSKTPDAFLKDDKLSKLVKPTDLTQFRDVFLNSIVNFGLLGHNAIFAHRIAESNDQGLLTKDNVEWLVGKLKQNIGSPILPKEKITLDSIIQKKFESDWGQEIVAIRLPQTKSVEEWLSRELSGLWTKMIHAKPDEFEMAITSFNDDDWSLVRTFQYLMSTLLGNPSSTHVIIFTQSVWNLVERGLVPQDLATLQVHRMLRKYLYDW
ncbi:MAG: hypothetical protein E3J86_04675 [Candidatus Thorarchaeota archaeon]|nr:MAG: hypothetical protein E3J86_04675 [Candidatus Thorarchaeota archaeon]